MARMAARAMLTITLISFRKDPAKVVPAAPNHAVDFRTDPSGAVHLSFNLPLWPPPSGHAGRPCVPFLYPQLAQRESCTQLGAV